MYVWCGIGSGPNDNSDNDDDANDDDGIYDRVIVHVFVQYNSIHARVCFCCCLEHAMYGV